MRAQGATSERDCFHAFWGCYRCFFKWGLGLRALDDSGMGSTKEAAKVTSRPGTPRTRRVGGLGCFPGVALVIPSGGPKKLTFLCQAPHCTWLRIHMDTDPSELKAQSLRRSQGNLYKALCARVRAPKNLAVRDVQGNVPACIRGFYH